MELPEQLHEVAKSMALGNVLSDWNELSWDEVIAILEAEHEDSPYAWLSDERITVWEPFETQPPVFLLEQLDSLYGEFLSAMTAGYNAGKEAS
jgi:hypothetical protein